MTTHRDPAWAGLLARFDSTLLRPPEGDAAAAAGVLAQPSGRQLLDWCHGAPALASASLEGPGAQALAGALALHLDGSDRLAACGSGAARLALRLRVKAEDLAALWRAPRRGDCWDSGWLADEAAALTRLARWQPRRATLVLVAGPQGEPGDPAGDAALAITPSISTAADARWHAACHLLAARAAGGASAAALARPVRLLRVADTPVSSGQSLRLIPAGNAAITADKSSPDTA